MKAALYYPDRGFEVQSINDPVIERDDDVLLKVHSVGICGSDLHYFRENRIGQQVIDGPFLMGHECTAVVDAVGKSVTRVKPGDRVAVEPAISCGCCSQCRAGRFHTCLNLTFLGAPGQLEGGLREFMVMPEENCILLPEAMDAAAAIWVEPLSIALHAIGLVKVPGLQSAGILGSGPIGLSVLHAIQDRGMQAELITDKRQYRLDIAHQMGAALAVPESEINASYSDQLDVVFECCGQESAFYQAVHLLKPGGHLVIIGIPEVDRWSIDPHELRRKEITVYNVRRQNECMGPALEMLSESVEAFNPLITHRFALDQVQQGFELAEGYNDGVIKAVVQP